MMTSYAKMAQASLQDFNSVFECYNLTDFFRAVDTEEEIITYATENRKAGFFLSSKLFIHESVLSVFFTLLAKT